MKKFVMIFAGVAMLGAVVVGVLNKQDIENLRDKLTGLIADVKDATERLGEAEDKRDDTQEKEVQATDLRNQARALLTTSKDQLARVNRSLEDVTAELKKVNIEQQEIDLAIRQRFPDGKIRTAEDLKMALTMLQDDLTENQNRKAELTAEMEAANQAKQIEVAKVAEEEQFQATRSQKVALNSMTATVIAVNKEWGFVMVNAGRAHGVAGDSSLLVKRKNARIGRLRIISLEDHMVVADVVKDSVSDFAQFDICPGDKVIFESTN
ncbi:MAG: hypothetical protein AAF357_13435 [Verrucomicrobiota bacterium]